MGEAGDEDTAGRPGAASLRKRKGHRHRKARASSESERTESTEKRFRGVKGSQPPCFCNRVCTPWNSPSLLGESSSEQSGRWRGRVGGRRPPKAPAESPPLPPHPPGLRSHGRPREAVQASFLSPPSARATLRRSWPRPSPTKLLDPSSGLTSPCLYPPRLLPWPDGPASPPTRPSI